MAYRTLLGIALSILLITQAHAGEISAADPARTSFVRLQPLPAPRIAASSDEYPNGSYKATNLVDGNPKTEYSSKGDGTKTFVEFDFGRPVTIAAFRHQDRNDPATIAASELSFMDADGKALGAVAVKHVNQRAGLTFLAFPQPITAQRVRWQVRQLGPQNHGTVGGAEIAFYSPGPAEPAPRGISIRADAPQLLQRAEPAPRRPLVINLDYPYAAPAQVTVKLAGVNDVAPATLPVQCGAHSATFSIPEVPADRTLNVVIEYAGQEVARQEVSLKPVRPLVIYLLPHSHVDIGYTALQADVEKKQNENLDIALRLIAGSRNYPEGSRFRWNVEVLWPVENYLRTATPQKQEQLLSAIRSGEVGLDALYGNILTGLCRPEELLRMCSYATRLAERTGVKVESAMISDVPGYTWSTVSALAHARVKYFSFAPNYFDRMGGTMVTWQNKPFWWKGPDGQARILCWCPSRGYALGHLIGDGEALARFMPDYLRELDSTGYPYDITHLRWNVHGDNGSPDEKLSQVVRDWNARHIYPRMIITTTAQAFRAFEQKYGSQLPEFSGDYTPYWEDGAGSSARETALNRAAAERLVQAETIWALRNPGPFPAEAFTQAWRNVLLYSEHTWGAHNSISQPDLPFVRDQWKVKQAFAVEADRQSQELLSRATSSTAASSGSIDIYNTSSWPRTDLVTLAADQSTAGDRVVDDAGEAVPSQRLSTGELAFLAREVPPLAARRYRIQAGAASPKGNAKASGATLAHPQFTIQIDEQTGGIASLRSHAADAELVDRKAGTLLNDYFYLPGSDLKGLQRNGKPRITVLDSGPLVATLRIESDAPGCNRLVRDIRIVDGLDHIQITNVLDKKPIRQKEGVHFGFGFNVPDGTVRFDVGWAVVRPEIDQIPAACKNWFSVQRWADISNDRYGVTWATIDAPLVEVGGITANLVGSQTDHRVWIQHLQPSQVLYSWVMNNHWHTNYRADQEGPTTFRYVIRPHAAYSPVAAAQFGAACSQSLIVTLASDAEPVSSRLTVSSDSVLLTAFKPSDDGNARIVRLFGASGKPENVTLKWNGQQPKGLWLSDTSEKPLQPVQGGIQVPAWGIVTLRAEF